MVENAQLALKNTLKQLQAQRAKIDNQIRAVQAALAAIGPPNPSLANRRRRGPMGPAERRSVSKRMKAYWAKRRASANKKAAKAKGGRRHSEL